MLILIKSGIKDQTYSPFRLYAVLFLIFSVSVISFVVFNEITHIRKLKFVVMILLIQYVIRNCILKIGDQ